MPSPPAQALRIGRERERKGDGNRGKRGEKSQESSIRDSTRPSALTLSVFVVLLHVAPGLFDALASAERLPLVHAVS